MLVEVLRLKRRLHAHTHQNRGYLPAAIRNVSDIAFVPGDDENAVGEGRTFDQRIDIGLEPVVGRSELGRVGTVQAPLGTVMRVILDILNNEGERGSAPSAQIQRELR